jgi:hypothetical protein
MLDDLTRYCNNADQGPRKVAGVALLFDNTGPCAVLLRRRDDLVAPFQFDLPGGDLAPHELPVSGIRRWLALSKPFDPDAANGLRWHWLQHYTIVPRVGGVGVGFVLMARVLGDAFRLDSDDRQEHGALLWADLATVRHWSPFVPDAVLSLLIVAAMTTPDSRRPAVQAIHANFIWPECRAGQVLPRAATGSDTPWQTGPAALRPQTTIAPPATPSRLLRPPPSETAFPILDE